MKLDYLLLDNLDVGIIDPCAPARGAFIASGTYDGRELTDAECKELSKDGELMVELIHDRYMSMVE